MGIYAKGNTTFIVVSVENHLKCFKSSTDKYKIEFLEKNVTKTPF